jgi:hypothetical protein
MARLNKTARGKHRWVGIRIGQPTSREGVKSVVRDALGDMSWRLFDVNKHADSSLAIIKVKLVDYPSAVSNLNANTSISTVTSSGKIRLVRSRLSVFKISE